MGNYNYTEKCREISGFGGSYEDTCRQMVIQGMDWIDKNESKSPEFTQYENIIGIIIADNEDAKSLEEAITSGFDGLTGAMVHATTNHVLAARRLGWNKYIEAMEKID